VHNSGRFAPTSVTLNANIAFVFWPFEQRAPKQNATLSTGILRYSDASPLLEVYRGLIMTKPAVVLIGGDKGFVPEANNTYILS
jgi:hypothetical protein